MEHSFIASNVLNFKVLEPLQGVHVPRFAGVFAHGTVYCMVFEDVGRALSWAEQDDPKIERVGSPATTSLLWFSQD
jgi:hypothetical protein